MVYILTCTQKFGCSQLIYCMEPRWHPVSSGTIPTCKRDTLRTCAERWSTCATLAAAFKDWIHLQPQTQTAWLRTHCKTRTLNTNNFIIPMLYKTSHWQLHTLSSIMRTCDYFIKRILYYTVQKQKKLEALGQCIPPPRHVLSVSRYGSGSLIWITTKI